MTKQFLIKKIKNSNYPEFFEKVWLECLKIKKGHLSTYSGIAKKIGYPKAARAVGNALGKNPFAPDVPCHRVIRKAGEFGGYSKGLARKIQLLKKEGHNFSQFGRRKLYYICTTKIRESV